MSREQNLVDEILKDGRCEAQKLVKKAQRQSKQILEEKKQEEQKFFEEQIQALKEEHEFLIESQKHSQNLEKNKLILGAKNEILNQVYDKTLKNLCNLLEAELKPFFENALSFAENENTVVVANEKDKKIVQKLGVFKTKKLKLCKEFGDFCGGLMIVSQTKEIDFSFESLLNEKFEAQKASLAKQLFEG